MTEITLWRSLTDAHGTRETLGWAELGAMLATPAPRPADAENPKLAGWSPATFKADKRGKAGVELVTALGLDLDAGALPLERVREAFAGARIIVHSTRRYTPEAPRWRVVVATSRAMTPTEHAVVWEHQRAVLASMGIALDAATKDPSRFWFVPCEPLAGEYVCEAIEGEPLDVDAALAAQPELPVAPAAALAVTGSPTVVLAQPDEPEGLARITTSTRKRRALAYVARAEASVSGQDGHGVAMRVASAVVRGFALGSTGEALNVLESWNARCEPPWSARELMHKVTEAMRVGAIPWGKMLLADLEPEEEPESEGGAAKVRVRKVAEQLWEKRLLKDKKGVKRLLANVMLVLTHADAWTGAVAWDEFAERIIITRECPAGSPGPWSDVADSLTAEWMQQSRWHIDAGPELVAAAVRAVADRQRIHPVRDWLSSLTWDGTSRLDTWLLRYLGVVDTPYARAVGRRFLVSAVARTFKPGCQVDTMLILEGDQGLRKSSALRVLAGDDWFLETQVDLRDPNACHALRRRWIVEFSELAALKGSDVERVKSFVSTRVDSYRPPYGRHVLDHPRQCVLVGSTNARQYLRDETGARRFWPVRVVAVDLAALSADREQLWAEARAAFDAGEPWYLDSAELHDAASDEQEERRAVDPWEESIRDYLNSPSRQSSGVGIQEIMGECLRIEIHNRSRGDEMRIGSVITKLGWERKRVRLASSLAYRYFKRQSENGGIQGRDTESSMIPNALPTVPTVPTVNGSSPLMNDTTQRGLIDEGGTEGSGGISPDETGSNWWETDA